jgi:hypothetical protein
MADIDIERKKRSPLPWILGLLALAILAFLLMRSCGDDDAEPATVVTDTTTYTDTTTGAYTAPAAAPVTDTTMTTTADTTTGTSLAPAGAPGTDTTRADSTPE